MVSGNCPAYTVPAALLSAQVDAAAEEAAGGAVQHAGGLQAGQPPPGAARRPCPCWQGQSMLPQCCCYSSIVQSSYTSGLILRGQLKGLLLLTESAACCGGRGFFTSLGAVCVHHMSLPVTYACCCAQSTKGRTPGGSQRSSMDHRQPAAAAVTEPVTARGSQVRSSCSVCRRQGLWGPCRVDQGLSARANLVSSCSRRSVRSRTRKV